MRFTITDLRPATPPVTYPRLMITTHPVDSRYVVLFSCCGVGMVIASEVRAHYRPGHYSQTWGMGGFTEFVGTVALTEGAP